MRRIAILNQKGGVGKTTTAVNLSAALAASGRRVTIVDLDPQAHATLHLGVEPGRDDRSIYDVLVDDTPLSAVRRQIEENLWLVGSHIDLAAVELELAGVVGREVILRDKLADDDQAAADSNDRATDDFLLVDCPPSLGILTINALAAVDEVFIPLQPHFLALHGLSKLLETIELVARRLNPRLTLGGIIMCMFDTSTRLAGEVSRDVDVFLKQSRDRRVPWSGAQVFETRIRRNIRLAEAPSFGQSIFRYAPTSHGADDYRQLAAEVLAASGASGSGKDVVPLPASGKPLRARSA
ncbi:MAG TPA: AAA family ATPase [Pirellulales bacterium]|jgi:chromosome partitioning protein